MFRRTVSLRSGLIALLPLLALACGSNGVAGTQDAMVDAAADAKADAAADTTSPTHDVAADARLPGDGLEVGAADVYDGAGGDSTSTSDGSVDADVCIPACFTRLRQPRPPYPPHTALST
jgi:hypothetical protein